MEDRQDSFYLNLRKLAELPILRCVPIADLDSVESLCEYHAANGIAKTKSRKCVRDKRIGRMRNGAHGLDAFFGQLSQCLCN